jgi:hypothetical protein
MLSLVFEYSCSSRCKFSLGANHLDKSGPVSSNHWLGCTVPSPRWKEQAFVLEICRERALLLLKLRELLGYAEGVGDMLGELR